MASNAGADGLPIVFDVVAGISSIVLSSPEPAPNWVVRVVLFVRRLLLLLFMFAVDVERDVDSPLKQSLMCQHNHKHEPTPTSVNINDVSALITMSVLFGVGSFVK